MTFQLKCVKPLSFSWSNFPKSGFFHLPTIILYLPPDHLYPLSWRFFLMYTCIWIVVVHVQSCPTLCNPTNCSPPGSSVHGILQARILEWVAIYFSRGSSRHRDRNCITGIFCIGADSLPLSPYIHILYIYLCLNKQPLSHLTVYSGRGLKVICLASLCDR